MNTLFRDEAIRAQGVRLLGEPAMAQPLPVSTVTGLVVLVVPLLLIYSALATYARKEVVTGYILPERGIVQVNASRSGVVGEIFVREGDFVEAGTPLISIVANRTSFAGQDLDAAKMKSVEAQLSEIGRLQGLAVERNELKAQQARLAVQGLLAEKQALQSRLDAQRDLGELVESNLQQVQALGRKGYASARQVAARQESLLTTRQSVATLLQQAAALDSEILRQRALLAGLPIELEQVQSELRSKRSGLELQRLQIAELGSAIVKAPVAGTIGASVVDHGDSVANQQNLLSLLPHEGHLEAHLYVSTRAIGFVKKGQQVRLLYDAFDYRRYGPQEGRVVEVSSAALSAAESFRRVQRNEPTYKVRVALADQAFQANDQRFELHAGMTLRADVILERRSILGWLTDPILALQGRM